MLSLRWTARVLLLLSVAAAVAACWLVLDNPSIDGTSRGDDYTCLAPYETVLLHGDNTPGGEPPQDAVAIHDRCEAAGARRFELAVAAAAGSVVLLLGGVVVRERDRHSVARY
ncbi:hypothetical protein [Nocardioides bruguierae]|uniref:Lipoprotein n=1 Tax=Nocardioides bruguierae TaxID=2945102 RepID=A0A9X2IGR5_9ACTN|nr:hypothetical protein [Nocardioides bruguierae]MCM0622642.1 hypothetical protein [Nocardioides bruguierae]